MSRQLCDMRNAFFILDPIRGSFFFFQAEDGIRDLTVTGVQTCALPISFSLSARLAAEGQNTLHIVATDAAGHSTDSVRTVIRDTQQPVLTVTNPANNAVTRSEEHTSELQSQSNLVCRLLLEKKNKNTTT